MDWAALQYAHSKVQAHQGGLQIKRTYQFLGYPDDVNLLDGNVHAANTNTKLRLASMEVGLEVNSETIKYMFMSREEWRTKSEHKDE
jgi:hypothetical protein